MPVTTSAGLLPRNIVGGIIFLTIAFPTLVFGSVFLLGPLVPCLLISHSWVRRSTDFFVSSWLTLILVLIERLFGIRLYFSGDLPCPKENPIIVMNHSSRVDWLYYMYLELYFGRISNFKIVLKNQLKSVPYAGWAMALSMFMFLKRRWEVDCNYLQGALGYFKSMGYPLRMLIFPEGTNMEPSSLQSSHRYAEKTGLRKYHYVLHPRTTGFVFVVNNLRSICDYVYDVSVGYIGSNCLRETDMLFGRFPSEVHLLVKKYPMQCLSSDEETLKQWLLTRWEEKEAVLQKFYQNGEFAGETRLQPNTTSTGPTSRLVLVYMAGWIVICTASIYALYVSWIFRTIWVLLHIMFVIMHTVGPGMDVISVQLARRAENKSDRGCGQDL